MKGRLFSIVILFFITLGGFITSALSADVPRMTKDELNAMLGNPDLVIIDVRYGEDWTDSDLKIKGAIREDPINVKSWANKYPKNKTLVLYCA